MDNPSFPLPRCPVGTGNNFDEGFGLAKAREKKPRHGNRGPDRHHVRSEAQNGDSSRERGPDLRHASSYCHYGRNGRGQYFGRRAAWLADKQEAVFPYPRKNDQRSTPCAEHVATQCYLSRRCLSLGTQAAIILWSSQRKHSLDNHKLKQVKTPTENRPSAGTNPVTPSVATEQEMVSCSTASADNDGHSCGPLEHIARQTLHQVPAQELRVIRDGLLIKTTQAAPGPPSKNLLKACISANWLQQIHKTVVNQNCLQKVFRALMR